MGGLAVGAAVFGRRADRDPAPLRTYVRLELAIAVYGLLVPLVVAVAGRAYVALGTQVFEWPNAKLALRFALALATIAPPAILMGGTLPVLARHVVTRLEHTQALIGRLYAANTFGAVLGTAIAGFVTLPLSGVYGSLAAAIALNLAAAGLASTSGGGARADRRRAGASAPGRPAPAPPAAAEARRFAPHVYRLTLFALAASGFAAMGYEVVFTKLIALAFGSSAYSFTVMLVGFIAGLGVGAWVAGRRPVRDPVWLLGAAQLAVVVTLLATTPLVERLSYIVTRLRIAFINVPNGFTWLLAAETGLCLAMLLAPTVCLGLGFPLVAAVQARQPARLGTHIGTTYAWNTAGNVLGAVGTTLVLIPALGVLATFHVLVAATALAGVVLLVAARETPVSRRALPLAVTAAAALVYGVAGTGWTTPILLARNHLRIDAGPDPTMPPAARAQHPASSFAAWRRDRVDGPPEDTFHLAEDAHATVLAYEDHDGTVLYVDGKPDASTILGDLPTQLLLGHTPLFLNPAAETVLVVGHGSGITAGGILRHPVKRLDVVELSRAVLDVDHAFAEENHHVLADPRVRVYEDDAQSFLRTVSRRYDVVVSEPTNPWIAGVGDLFTAEYFRSVRTVLNPGGVAVLWFHEYDLDDDAVALVLRTAREVFPNLLLFRVFSWGDIFAVGSVDPIVPDFEAMERRWESADVQDDLGRLEVPNLAAFLSHQSIPSGALDRVVGPGPINTMARERLAYAAPRTFFRHSIARRLGEADVFLSFGADRGSDDLLLDRYTAFRAGVGEPLSRDELAEAARYHAIHAAGRPTFAPAIERRAAAAASRAVAGRGARGDGPPVSALSQLSVIARARRLATAGNDEEAVPLYERALQAEPDHAMVAFELAQSLQKLQRPEAAVTVLEAMRARRPDSVRIESALAFAYVQVGRRDEALAAYKVLLERYPTEDSLVIVGALLLENGRAFEAELHFERALALDPTSWEAAGGLVQILLPEPAHHDRARRLLDQALQFHPDQPELLKAKEALAAASSK
jgi:spermidine synthase/tetratricopeptide (TPR) repeat protein